MNIRCLLCLLFLFFILTPDVKSQSWSGIYGWFETKSFVESNVQPANYNHSIALLFPDTGRYQIDSSGVAVEIDRHSAGHIFDVMHDNWAAVPSTPDNPIMPLNLNSDFFWDSLRFDFFYRRGFADTQVIDTVLVYYYHNFRDTMIASVLLAVDSPYSMRMAQPATFDITTLSGKKYVKIDTLLLDNTFSAKSTTHTFRRAVYERYDPSKFWKYPHYRGLFGFSVVFKPGHPTKTGDTLFDARDSSSHGSNVFGVYKSRVAKLPVLYTAYYNENSYWLIKETRNGNNYKGFEAFVPAPLIGDAIDYFNCATFITASPPCVSSVNEYSGNSGVCIKSISPNPASANDVINVEIAASKEVSIKVIVKDVTAKTVAESDLYDVYDVTNVTLRAALNSGIYMVLLQDNQSNAVLHSAKLIISD